MYFIFCQCIKLPECTNNSQLGLPLCRLLTNHCKHLYRAKHKTQMDRKKLQEKLSPYYVMPKLPRMVKSHLAPYYLLQFAGLRSFMKLMLKWCSSSKETLLWMGKQLVLNILAELAFFLAEDIKEP